MVVIGHDIWKRRFSGDPGVVGRTVRLGSERRTVAGVMPEGFAFPAAHEIWIPLRVDTVGSGTRRGTRPPGVRTARSGRVQSAGAGRVAGDRSTRRRLVCRGRTSTCELNSFRMPGCSSTRPTSRLGLALGNIFVVMLLVLVSANVALLMFARAATRESEIAVRSALGASRARIVGQLFVEGLVLAALAVVVGLVAARVGVRSLLATLEADCRTAASVLGERPPHADHRDLRRRADDPERGHHQRSPRAEGHQPRTGGPASAIDGRGRRLPVRRGLDRRHRGAGRRHADVSGRLVFLSSLGRRGTDPRRWILHRHVPLGAPPDRSRQCARSADRCDRAGVSFAPPQDLHGTGAAPGCRTRGRRFDVCRSAAGNAASSLVGRGRRRGGDRDVRPRAFGVFGLGRAELLRCRRCADPGGSRVHGRRCRVALPAR